MNDPVESLRRGFVVEDKKENYVIACRSCKARWSLKASGEIHPGNLLHLLNHEMSHAGNNGGKK